LIEDETRAFYFSICRGLFERDKLLYSFLNATSILRRFNKINVDEWNFFLRGSPSDFTKFENRIDFISDDVHKSLLGLEETHTNFKDIVKSFEDPSKLTKVL
jgi:dynein heavy chain, axonemal